MRHDSDKILRSVLKYLLKLLFICLLLGILYYSFKDSMGDMSQSYPKSPHRSSWSCSSVWSPIIFVKGTSPG